MRNNVLTSKQKEVKDLLFKKKRQDEGPRATNNLDTVKKEKKQGDEELDKHIHGFMKDINTEMKKMNDGGVSKDMLHHQNDVLISHAKLMNEHQEVIKKLLQKNQGGRGNNDASSEMSKAVIQELMKPIVSQVEQIKTMYEETKKSANEVNETLNHIKKGKKLDLDGQPQQEKDFLDKFGNYISTHQKLRDKFSEADNLTKQYKDKFKDLENFESDQYLKNLARLNKELRELEQRSTKGQQELENRIEGVNKKYNLVLPATYVEAIKKNMKSIDFIQAKQDIDDKLGGEFDYNEFQVDIERLMTEYKADKSDYQMKLRETDLIVPERPGKSEKEYFDKIQSAPGILDNLKERIEKIKKSAQPPVAEVAQSPGSRPDGLLASHPIAVNQNSKPSSNNYQQKNEKSNKDEVINIQSILDKPKKSNMYNKPDHLRRLITKPLPCQVDVRFRKLQPDPADYATYFDDPDPIDIQQIEKRINEPYDEQLRKEYASQQSFKNDYYDPSTKRKEISSSPHPNPLPSDKTRRHDNIDSNKNQESRENLKPTRDNQMNTQELIEHEKPLRTDTDRIDQEYPKISKDITTPFDSVDEDMDVSRRQKDLFTVDDRGVNILDEEILKDRIRNNMGSIKDYLKNKAGYKPFVNFADPDDKQDRYSEEGDSKRTFPMGGNNPSQRRENQLNDYLKKEAQEKGPGTDSNGPFYDPKLVKDISENFGKMLNDIISNVNVNRDSDKGNRNNDMNRNTGSIQPNHSERNQTGKDRYGLGDYYNALNNNQNNRSSQPQRNSRPLPPSSQNASQKPLVLDDYITHLRSIDNKNTVRNIDNTARIAESSVSEGEVKPNTTARFAQQPLSQDRNSNIYNDQNSEGAEKSEGEISGSFQV